MNVKVEIVSLPLCLKKIPRRDLGSRLDQVEDFCGCVKATEEQSWKEALEDLHEKQSVESEQAISWEMRVGQCRALPLWLIWHLAVLVTALRALPKSLCTLH